MTYIPDGPLWCWVLQGADVVFFSQPTCIWEGTAPRWLGDLPACVARCGFQKHVVLDDRPFDLEHPEACLTPPIQCGAVAQLDPLGRFLCGWHWSESWTCRACGADLPHGQGGLCSEACRRAIRDGPEDEEERP